jgi:hypothetical protein
VVGLGGETRSVFSKKMKYKIVISEGCTANAIVFNGKDWVGEYEPMLMSESEKNDAVEFLLEKIREGLKDGTVVINELVQCFLPDKTEWSERCDQCGDSVVAKTWEFDS